MWLSNTSGLIKEYTGWGKLSLREAPYTYARVSAMKSKLIRRDDYNKLMKMKVGDIIRFLQETDYKREMDEMAVSHTGVELVEFALNKSIAKTFAKLKRIAEYDDLRIVMEEYMKRRAIWNIKTIIRGKFIGEDESKIKELVMATSRGEEAFLNELLKKDSVEDVIRSLKFLSPEQTKNALDLLRDKRTLFGVENTLDNYYYSSLLEFSKRIPSQGIVIREFIRNEIDVLNIKTVLRLKKHFMPLKEIEKFIMLKGARISKESLARLASADSVENVIALLQKMGYRKAFKDAGEKSKKDLAYVELRLNKYMLDRVALLLHKHPLSVDVILGFMFAKEIEIRNLRTIIKGKQLSLKEEFIEGELVIGG